MIDAIYVEDAVRDHPRSADILARFPHASVIPCAHYGAVFNRAKQNFRVQKQRPALILARKDNRRVLPVPAGYSLDGVPGYYFSHALNCLYDCRYCFLQGMFRSAHYVLFVNYDEFVDDIRTQAAAHAGPSWFFSGYDCDSLALEPVTGFADRFLDAFASIDHAWLELRTKSTQVRALLDREPLPRVVCAFSLSPAAIAERLEHRAPGLDARLDAARRLAQAGWRIGLRFDPVIAVTDSDVAYRRCFERVAEVLDGVIPHSITLGPLRLPKTFYDRMQRLYPDEALFAAGLIERNKEVGYSEERRRALLDTCETALRARFAATPVYRQGDGVAA